MLSRWDQHRHGGAVKAVVTAHLAAFCLLFYRRFSLIAFWIQNAVCNLKARTYAGGKQHMLHQGASLGVHRLAEDQAQKCFE